MLRVNPSPPVDAVKATTMSQTFQDDQRQPPPECLLDALPYGVLIADATRPDSPVLYANPALEKLTGYSSGEILGRSWPFLQGPDTDPAAFAQICQALREGRECRVVLKSYRKDGRPFWNDWTISPVRDAEGRYTHALGVVSDITTSREASDAQMAALQRLEAAYARERRIAETLQENDLQLVDLLESLTEGFFALDIQWRFTYLNQQAEPLLGRTRANLLGQDLWEAFPELRGGSFDREFHRATSERAAIELTEFFAPQAAWWDVRAYPTAEGLTVFLRDVTEHHRAEEEKREMQARQRTFLRDVLASVTEGKLHLCYRAADLPALRTPAGEPIILTRTDSLSDLRHRADRAALAVGLSEDQRSDLALSVGEAAMNAVVHAGMGTGRVSTSETGTVQVRIEDHGTGIAVENLPKATLERGYTTAGTMGHGMKIMLQALDRLWLLTSPAGTTVVLEKDRIPPEPEWLHSHAQKPDAPP